MKAVRRSRGGAIERQAGEPFQITFGGALTSGLQGVGAAELNHADGGGDVGEIVFEPRRHHVVCPRGSDLAEAIERIAVETMSSHDAHAGGDVRVAGYDHAAFARRDRLVSVKAEHTGVRFPRADRAAGSMRRQGVRGILNNPEMMAAGEVEHGSRIARKASEMDRNNRLAAWRNATCSVFEIDRARFPIDIDKNNFCA